MKKCFVILCLLYLISPGFAQQTTGSEKRWLIDHYFDKDQAVNEKLSAIDRDITLGRYEAAKATIWQMKAAKPGAFTLATVLCYEAVIAYNESAYKHSIALCDSASRLFDKPQNRYLVKTRYRKVLALCALNEYDTAQNILDSTIAYASGINDDYGLAACFYIYGILHIEQGDYSKGIACLNKSIVIRKAIGDQSGLAASYSFMGLAAAHKGNYIEGIAYIQQSIVIREKLEEKRGLANSYLNLYKIYMDIGEEDKAMASEFKSLGICQDINDLQCISGRLTNIGQIYQDKGNYMKAMQYHRMALEISKKLNIKNRVALVYENMARVNRYTGHYEEAKRYIDSSAVLRNLISDQEGLASSYLVLAQVNLDLNETEPAILHAGKALDLGKQLNLPYLLKDAHQLLSSAYTRQNQFEKALIHYRNFIVLRDSIYNIDKTREITRKELEFNFNKKQEIQKLEQDRLAEKTNRERKKERLIILVSGIALLILSGLLMFSIRQYRLKKRSEEQLRLLNTNLNQKNVQLQENQLTIETQHTIIHRKNTEITDSIRYAQNIQSSMMPSTEEFESVFKEAFIMFAPKDIISGDFYWLIHRNQKIIYVTADCTGHGVPGGFMSMLGVSLLNEIVNENGLTEPALILSRLRKKVIKALKQKGIEGEHQDGMDMTICVHDRETMTLQYAGANHSFYLIRKQEGTYTLGEYKGDKQPVGIFGNTLRPFNQHTIQLQEGDSIYTFTDGYADQFGGPGSGKKFKYRRLKELLLAIQDQPMKEQHSALQNTFSEWKGKLEQVDDVCIIGIRV